MVNEALATTRPGVFAAGDAVSGPATVVEAVAQGNLVAVAVDHWLKTGEYAKPRYETPRPDIAQHLQPGRLCQRPTAARARTGAGPSAQGSFAEVELGFDEHTVREEAKRCLRCDLEWLDYMKIARPQAVTEEA